MNETSNMPPLVFRDKTYNIAKWLVTIVLPASGTLYFALAQTWGLPAPEQVLGTIVAVQTFMGVLLGISSSQYKNSDARFDGTLTTSDTPDKTIVSVETDLHPSELVKKDEVVLKVK